MIQSIRQRWADFRRERRIRRLVRLMSAACQRRDYATARLHQAAFMAEVNARSVDQVARMERRLQRRPGVDRA